MAFTPDGRALLSASSDGITQLQSFYSLLQHFILIATAFVQQLDLNYYTNISGRDLCVVFSCKLFPGTSDLFSSQSICVKNCAYFT